MMAQGSDFFAGDPIVTSGWRSGVAHLTFGNRRLEPGDTILLELSGCRRRYFGPLMRGAADRPGARRGAPDVGRHHRGAERGHRGDPARRDQRRGGRACREPIERAGFEPNFRKRTGYSVGVGYAPSWGEGHIVSLRRGRPDAPRAGHGVPHAAALRVPRQYGLGYSETVLVTPPGAKCSRTIRGASTWWRPDRPDEVRPG
jgi:Xaa-Pro dipeptidase